MELEEAIVRGTIHAEAGDFLGSITIGTAGSFSSGQTAYDTGTGFWLEYNSGTPRLSIGNSAGNKLTWDGTNLSVSGLSVSGATLTGSLVISTGGSLSSGQSSWDGGTGFWFEYNGGTPRMSIGDGGSNSFKWTGTALEVTALTVYGAITLSTQGSIGSGQSAYDTGTGFWLEYNAGTPRLSIGNASGNKLTWDGTLLSVTGTVQSGNYSSGVSGWKIDQGGVAEFQDIIARGSIRSSVFEYSEISAISGSQSIVPSAGTLLNDVTVVASPTTFDVDIKDPESAHTQLFASGNVLRLKYAGSDSWVTISSVTDNTTYYTYTCVLSSGDTGTYEAGTAVLDYGQSGDGNILFTADAATGPHLSVATHAGSPWSTQTEKLRLGNLNGWGAFASDVYGFALGDYSTNRYLTFDDSSDELNIYSGTGRSVKIGADGIVLLKGQQSYNGIYWSNFSVDTLVPMAYMFAYNPTTNATNFTLTTTVLAAYNTYAEFDTQTSGGGTGNINGWWTRYHASNTPDDSYEYLGRTVSGAISFYMYYRRKNTNWGTVHLRGIRLSSSSAAAIPAQGYLQLANGTEVNEFSIDGTLAGNSDDAVPTEQAVKTFVETLDAGKVSDLYESDGGGPAWSVDAAGELSGDGDIYPGGDNAGLFERVNAWFTNIDDHLNAFSGYTWASYTGFGTPNSISTSYYNSLLRVVSSTTEKAFAYKALDTGIETRVAILVGGTKSGVRMDDGTDNNYVELWIDDEGGGLIGLYLRYSVGGSVTTTQLWGGNAFPAQFVDLRLVRSGQVYYAYAGIGVPIQQYVGTTGNLGWTATQLGLYHQADTVGANRGSVYEYVRYT